LNVKNTRNKFIVQGITLHQQLQLQIYIIFNSLWKRKIFSKDPEGASDDPTGEIGSLANTSGSYQIRRMKNKQVR